jgi:hypothetical protein
VVIFINRILPPRYDKSCSTRRTERTFRCAGEHVFMSNIPRVKHHVVYFSTRLLFLQKMVAPQRPPKIIHQFYVNKYYITHPHSYTVKSYHREGGRCLCEMRAVTRNCHHTALYTHSFIYTRDARFLTEKPCKCVKRACLWCE